MHPFLSNASRRLFRSSEASEFWRVISARTAWLSAALVVAVIGSVSFGASAVWADSPAPTPSPSATPMMLASAITITSPAGSSFRGKNSFAITGAKAANSSVVVTATPSGGSATTVCATTTASQDDLGWSCTATAVPNGKLVKLAAKQTLESDSSTSKASVAVNVLGAPSLDGPGSFVTPGIVSGGAITGNTVTVTLSSPSGVGCTSGVVNGYWSCSIGAPSGTYTVSAHQSWAAGDSQHSEESHTQSVTIDKERPAKPVVSSPRAHSRVLSQPVTFEGTGEPLGYVNVYVDASPVCGAGITSSGRWSCTASGIANGAHAVQAIQSDAAGNFSDPSAALKVYFGPKAAPVVPPSSSTPSGSPSPAPTTPSPTPRPHTAPPAIPYVPGSGAPPPSLHESLTNWGTPTAFGAKLPTLAETVRGGLWIFAPLLALGFILLIALPLKLLASSLRGRLRLPRAQFTGRNRNTESVEDAPTANPWLIGAVPLAAAAAFIVLAVGVNSEVRFVRLLAAVGIGLAILNVVGVAVATRVSAHSQGAQAHLRFLPLLLVAAVLLALFSRLTGASPLLVAGVLIGVGFAAATPVKARAVTNLVEVGVLTLIAVLAWLAHGWMTPAVGFWANLSVETLTTLCLAGLGSAMVLMLPLGRLPGRVILTWSPIVWVIGTAVVATLSWVIVVGSSAAAFSLVGALLVAGSFTALSIAIWAWVRYVEPAQQV